MIIDFHVHCFPDEVASRAIPALARTAGIEAKLDGTLADVRRSMKKAGIDKSVVLSIATKPSQTEKVNDWSAKINGDDVIAFGSLHPEYTAWKEELQRIRQLGLKGIKLHPEYQRFYVDDRAMYPVYEHIFELGLIVVFHAGVDIGLPPPYHCTPDRLLRLVRDFPGGKMVAAHMGGYAYWEDVERLLIGTDIYLDTSFCLGRMDERRMRRMIDNHDPQRILFATDSPWSDQSEEVIKLKSLRLDPKIEKAILGENAKMLLGL